MVGRNTTCRHCKYKGAFIVLHEFREYVRCAQCGAEYLAKLQALMEPSVDNFNQSSETPVK